MVTALGENWSRHRVDCAAGIGDGHAFSSRAAGDGERDLAGAAVLLGTERHHVGNRIGDDGVRSANLWVPGGDVDGECLLFAGGISFEDGVSGRGEELTDAEFRVRFRVKSR